MKINWRARSSVWQSTGLLARAKSTLSPKGDGEKIGRNPGVAGSNRAQGRNFFKTRKAPQKAPEAPVGPTNSCVHNYISFFIQKILMKNKIILSPEAQQILVQLQTFQQQLQATILQRDSLNLQKIEIEKALEELEKVGEREIVYKLTGPILLKTTKKELESELKQKVEEIEVRLKSLEKLVHKLEEKMKEKQEKLKSILEGSPSSAAQ